MWFIFSNNYLDAVKNNGLSCTGVAAGRPMRASCSLPREMVVSSRSCEKRSYFEYIFQESP